MRPTALLGRRGGSVAVLAVTAAALAVPLAQTPLGATSDPARLVYSSAANRSNPATLDGATVRGKTYVTLTPPPGMDVRRVRFFTDGDTTNNDRKAPWDLKGSKGSGDAHPWDTTEWEDGRHVVAADITTPTGTHRVTAAVTIDNVPDATTSTSTSTTSTTTSTTSTTTSTTVAPQTDTVEGRTWHVQAGAASGGDGTVERPFSTIRAGLAAAQPGDRVEVGNGTYREEVDFPRSGTADARIVVAAANPLGAHIVGAGDTNNSTRLIELHQSYVTFTGFEVSHSNTLLYSIGGDHNVIAHNWFHHSGGEGLRLKYHADHNVIHDNVIEDTGRKNFDRNGIINSSGSKNGEGLYIGTSPSQLSSNPTSEVDTSTGNHVHHNVFRFGSEAVNLKEGTTGNLIEHNQVSGYGDPNAAGINIQGEANVVRSNDVRDGDGAGVRLGESTSTGDGVARGVGNHVYSNTFAGNAGYAVKVISTPQGSVCGNKVATGDQVVNTSSVDPLAPC